VILPYKYRQLKEDVLNSNKTAYEWHKDIHNRCPGRKDYTRHVMIRRLFDQKAIFDSPGHRHVKDLHSEPQLLASQYPGTFDSEASQRRNCRRSKATVK
jgi:hypothetical protein